GSRGKENEQAACQRSLRTFEVSRLRTVGNSGERKHTEMAVPQFLNDIIQVLLQLAPAAALVSLVLAGISLRREGGTTFLIGGGFTKWMFWAVIFVTLSPLLSWFTSFGVSVPVPAGGINTSWLSSFQSDVSNFVSNFVIG